MRMDIQRSRPFAGEGDHTKSRTRRPTQNGDGVRFKSCWQRFAAKTPTGRADAAAHAQSTGAAGGLGGIERACARLHRPGDPADRCRVDIVNSQAFARSGTRHDYRMRTSFLRRIETIVALRLDVRIDIGNQDIRSCAGRRPLKNSSHSLRTGCESGAMKSVPADESIGVVSVANHHAHGLEENLDIEPR